MALLPSIADTARRRLTPTADVQVSGVSPSAFGGAIGAGLQAVGEAGQQAGGALEQFELAKQAETMRLAEFDRQTKFVAFGSDQAQKLSEAARGLSGPAQDFTKAFVTHFDEDAADFLAEVPERERHAWAARMGQLRSGVSGDALRTEFSQRDAYYKTTIGDSLGKLQNGAMSSPDQLEAWRKQGEEIIATSGLGEQDKLEYTTKWKAQVTVAAATGDVQRDPEGAIARLGGIDFVVEGQGAEGGGTATGTKQDAIRSAAAKLGVTPVELAGLAHYESAGTMNPGVAGGDGGRYVGLFQFGPEEQRKYGVSRKSSFEDQVGAFVKFAKDRGYKPGMGWKKLYTTINAGNPNASVKAADSNGTQEDHYRNIEKAHFSKARDFLGVSGEGGVSSEGAVTTRTVGTGQVDPRYADLPIDARVQLISAAEREVDRRQNEVAQVEQQQHSEWLNGFLNELNDGKAGAADIEAARKSGQLTDFDEIKRAENIVAAKQEENIDLQNFSTMWRTPGFTFNPFDETQQKAVEAAVKFEGGSAETAFGIWQKTGILAKSGAVALRGSLISTDAKQVMAAASIASNMMAKNPNAFAGVSGGDDIERNALLYGHYVNDLGYSRDAAAAAVAKQNTPEMRRKIAMGQPEQAEFRKAIQKKDVSNMLSNAFGGWFSVDPEFTSSEQKNAASQDYADIAADHFGKYGDAAAAESFAMAQMKKLYGVANGRLMKFPPTRSYPSIGGSQSYIFSQAAADVKAVTGRTINPENVYLMPLPTATAEAFRAGKPTPYSVHYIDNVNGQVVYRVLNGKAFYADPKAASNATSAERGAEFARTKIIYEATRDAYEQNNDYARSRGGG